MKQQSPWYKSLAFSLAVLLSLALLPIGIIAVSQTEQASKEIALRSERALLTATEAAASREKRKIDRALGATDAVLPLLNELSKDRVRCDAFLAEVTTRPNSISYIAFVSADGREICTSLASAGRKNTEGNAKPLKRTTQTLRLVSDAAISDGPAISVETPVFDERGGYRGFLLMVIPQQRLEIPNIDGENRGRLQLLTFNRDGEILNRAVNMANPDAFLPEGRPLGGLAKMGVANFSQLSNSGEKRAYAVVTIVPGALFALGTWPPSDKSILEILPGFSPTFLPLLMWMICLLVAYAAAHFLVIRHIRNLRLQMRRFARNRQLDGGQAGGAVPAELERIYADFQDMASALMQDEARLEDNVREKNILLKEVHHRVKNNLQLISSIMNMMIRKTQNADTSYALKRLQDRVLSLAAMHRTLYTAEDVGRVDAAEILHEVIMQAYDSSALDDTYPRPELDIASIELLPDQAVPLALLVTELISVSIEDAVENGRNSAAPKVTLVARGVAEARLEIEIPKTSVRKKQAAAEDLSQQLIAAFSAQLNAHTRVTTGDEGEVFQATFGVELRDFAGQDY